MPRTRWWFENKGGNVRLSVVRVCCVKVIWHLPYSRPLSAIPVPAITTLLQLTSDCPTACPDLPLSIGRQKVSGCFLLSIPRHV